MATTTALAIADRIARDNPGVTVVNGSKHVKLMRGSQLVGVIQHAARKGSLSPSRLHNLRRAGLVVRV